MATILLTKIKIFRSLRFRVVFSYLLIIVVAFMAIGVSLIRLVGDYLLTQRVRDDTRIAETIVSRIAEPFDEMDALGVYAVALENCTADSRVLVLDTDGIVQVDSAGAVSGTRLASEEVTAVLNGEKSAYGFYDTDLDRSDRGAFSFYLSARSTRALYAVDISHNGMALGVLVYIASVDDIFLSLRAIGMKTLLWLVLVALIALIVTSLIMRSFTGPLNDMNEGIRKMSSGDLSARIKIRGSNEFTDLAVAFNKMSEKLEELDNSRSRFVSNASHELKTPLSTMKILIETLLFQDPMDPGMTMEFLGDINREIDRLNRIVSDLLTLSNIDSGSMKLTLAPLSLKQLLAEQVKRLLPLARENGIEIDFEPHDDVSLNADAVKLQQVFYNVIDNAIKYTPRGGEVNVTLSRAGKNAVIRIADTGIGIPASDIDHIFDRFYRVDKARSRATGGTGLGLSIVKQIVLQHGGNISAASTEGKGTTFEIVLPINK